MKRPLYRSTSKLVVPSPPVRALLPYSNNSNTKVLLADQFLNILTYLTYIVTAVLRILEPIMIMKRRPRVKYYIVGFYALYAFILSLMRNYVFQKFKNVLKLLSIRSRFDAGYG